MPELGFKDIDGDVADCRGDAAKVDAGSTIRHVTKKTMISREHDLLKCAALEYSDG